MSLRPTILLAELVLAVHVGIILFNLFGMIAIPIGSWRGWAFVRARAWRVLHLAALAAVAIQAVFGRACFLTLWQDALLGTNPAGTPLIMRWVDTLIYWRLPMAFFAGVYVAVFAYVLSLFWLVPPR